MTEKNEKKYRSREMVIRERGDSLNAISDIFYNELWANDDSSMCIKVLWINLSRSCQLTEVHATDNTWEQC